MLDLAILVVACYFAAGNLASRDSLLHWAMAFGQATPALVGSCFEERTRHAARSVNPEGRSYHADQIALSSFPLLRANGVN